MGFFIALEMNRVIMKKHMIIGSTAIKHYFPDFTREPKDLDIVIYEAEDKNELNILSNGKVEYLVNPVLLDSTVSDSVYPTVDELLTLKMSHLTRDVDWEKHLYDTQFLIKKGAKCIDSLYYDLIEYWNFYFGERRRSNLKLSSDQFFDNALNNEYDHDYLHTLLKEIPTYTKVLKDDEEVEPCHEKFEEMSFEEKCDLVSEEVMVMAYERFRKRGFRHAYTKMLKKFIMSHAPMWEMKFIVENYITLERPPYNYYEKIESQLDEAKKLDKNEQEIR